MGVRRLNGGVPGREWVVRVSKSRLRKCDGRERPCGERERAATRRFERRPRRLELKGQPGFCRGGGGSTTAVTSIRGFCRESTRRGVLQSARKLAHPVPVTRCYSRVTRTHSAATRSRALAARVVRMIQYTQKADRPHRPPAGRRMTAPTGMLSSWSRSRVRQMFSCPAIPEVRPVFGKEKEAPDTLRVSRTR